MNYFLLALMMTVSLSAFSKNQCGTHVRFMHGEAFRDEPVDVLVNGNVVVSNLVFRGVSKYIPMNAGQYKVDFVNSATGVVLESKSFGAGPNIGYSVIFAGPAQGPLGTRFGNSSPFIFVDDITPVSNPSRWKGTWYRMSETNVVIDLRVSDASDTTKEIARLREKLNRSSYQMGDIPSGTYQFNPVMPGSSEPFFNPALNPPRLVELKNIKINGGENFDVIALGNFLGKAPNSLDLTYSRYVSSLTNDGCFELEQ